MKILKSDSLCYCLNISLLKLGLFIIIILLSISSLKGNKIEKKSLIKLDCINNICHCKKADNFTKDSIVNYLKYYIGKEDTAILACMYHQLAIQYFGENNQQKAIWYSKEAIELREQFDDGWLWKSHLNLAKYFNYWKQYNQSIQYAEDALNLTGYPKRPKDSLSIYSLLAEGYKEVGEFENATLFSKKAISINASKHKVRDAMVSFSEILIATGDTINIKIGIKGLDSLKKIYLNEKDTNSLTPVLTHLGNAYYSLKVYDQSSKYYDDALDLLQDDFDKAVLSNNIGSTFIVQNKLDLAFKYLIQSLLLNTSVIKNKFNYLYAANYENFGDYYTKSNQLDSALLSYQKALINLTNNFRAENIYQNPNPKDTVLFIYSNPDMIRVLHLKATAAYQYYQQNNNLKYLTLASQSYQTAFNFHNKLQKDISTENSRLFQAKNIVPYIENALNVAYELQEKGKPISEAAFRFIEKNKATVLLQSMNEADALQFANLPDSLLEREKELKISIAFHQKQKNEAIEYENTAETERLNNLLFEERQQYSQVIQNLEDNYPDYYRLKYQQNLTKLADMQQSLNHKTALLEYFVGDRAIYILSVKKDQSKLYKTKKPASWQITFEEFMNCLYPTDAYTTVLFKSFTQRAYDLYQILLQQPLDDLNKQITNIKIIPDAALNYIPFEVLLIHRSNSTEVNYRNLPYLLKEKNISYAYSAALLLENLNNASPTYTYNYTGFAPAYEDSDYKNLSFAGDNVQRIAKLLSGQQYSGDQAIELYFKTEAQQFKTFQLAMHGVLDDENPLNSKLVFSKTNDTTDFELHAYELYNMQIPAQLGVLSACETGTGKQAKGEGMMSLSRAFTYAGCHSLVMSLWKIEDQATADIVYHFFQYLKKGKAKDEALKQAKLDFLDDAPTIKTHPVYWAGLIQSGNSQSIDFGTSKPWWFIFGLFLLVGIAVSLFFKWQSIAY